MQYFRLNCSMSHIKKFSKATLDMIAKNKSCSQEHIKDIVGTVNNLMSMLNLYEDASIKKDGIWYNINWGDDAPYWNQYYKMIKEYKYPFKVIRNLF